MRKVKLNKSNKVNMLQVGDSFEKSGEPYEVSFSFNRYFLTGRRKVVGKTTEMFIKYFTTLKEFNDFVQNKF